MHPQLRSRLTWRSNTKPYASVEGSWHFLAFSNKQEMSILNSFEVAYFLLLACVLNYHGMNDRGRYRVSTDLTSINFRDKGIYVTVSMK